GLQFQRPGRLGGCREEIGVVLRLDVRELAEERPPEPRSAEPHQRHHGWYQPANDLLHDPHATSRRPGHTSTMPAPAATNFTIGPLCSPDCRRQRTTGGRAPIGWNPETAPWVDGLAAIAPRRPRPAATAR